MYQRTPFVEQDPDTLLALMRAYPLATLIRGGSELAADLLPLEVDHAQGISSRRRICSIAVELSRNCLARFVRVGSSHASGQYRRRRADGR